jgi:hypothetical protein
MIDPDPLGIDMGSGSLVARGFGEIERVAIDCPPVQPAVVDSP